MPQDIDEVSTHSKVWLLVLLIAAFFAVMILMSPKGRDFMRDLRSASDEPVAAVVQKNALELCKLPDSVQKLYDDGIAYLLRNHKTEVDAVLYGTDILPGRSCGESKITYSRGGLVITIDRVNRQVVLDRVSTRTDPSNYTINAYVERKGTPSASAR